MDMETQVLQALARGYCHPENSGKIVDPDLIKAMAQEIIESFSPSRERCGDCWTSDGKTREGRQ